MVDAAKPAVVNISTIQATPRRGPRGADPMREFLERYFGEALPRQQPRQSLGSGLLVEADGYILTNNHVIETTKPPDHGLPELAELNPGRRLSIDDLLVTRAIYCWAERLSRDATKCRSGHPTGNECASCKESQSSPALGTSGHEEARLQNIDRRQIPSVSTTHRTSNVFSIPSSVRCIP
jgi:hypothetical protein